MEPNTLNAIPAFEIPIDSIVVEDRIRKTFGDIADLAESIKSEGLIQPIVVTATHRLVAGERRLRAHKHLGMATIKAVYIEVLDEAHLTRLEATENIARRDFDWKEKCLAIDKVHRRMSIDAIEKNEEWGIRETGRLLNTAKSPIGLAIFVAEYLHANDPEILAAESLQDAYRVLAKRRADEAAKQLVASSVPKAKIKKPGTSTELSDKLDVPSVDFFTPGAVTFAPAIGGPEDSDEAPSLTIRPPTVIPLSQMLLRQHDHNELTIVKSLGTASVDHIICDPPYAIDMDMLQQENQGQNIDSVRIEHDVTGNLDLLKRFIPLAYDTIKPNGFLIMFGDMMNWQFLHDTCKAAGFSVQRWPLIWHKTSSCSNGASGFNFTKNYEIAIVCRKGTATLVRTQPSSIWTGGSDSDTRSLGHPFAKPSGLWEWLFNSCCIRGATVLDPFAGVGSSTLAAVRLGLRPIAVESNEEHYNKLVLNVQNLYKSLDATCTFN